MELITVNSLSGGQTSSYIASNFHADENVFALVRTSDPKCKFPDPKIRQIVSDKIGKEFVGTLEMDQIIYIMLDLEQHIGKKIDWVSGITFDEVIKRKNGTIYLPNKVQRICTTHLKLIPIFHWWYKNHYPNPVRMNIGFRANEQRRAKNMISKLNANGLSEIKETVSKNKNGTNHWQTFEWQQPQFPLIDINPTYKDQIVEYWKKHENVRFGNIYHNNCVGCFHRNPLFLNKMFNSKHQNKMDWFADQEGEKKGFWKGPDQSYKKIKAHKMQSELSFDDFNDCDSGYCGL